MIFFNRFFPSFFKKLFRFVDLIFNKLSGMVFREVLILTDLKKCYDFLF